MKSSPQENNEEKCDWKVTYRNDAGYISSTELIKDKTKEEASKIARDKCDSWSRDHFNIDKV